MQFTDQVAGTVASPKYDYGVCDLTFTTIATLDKINAPVANDYYSKDTKQFHELIASTYANVNTLVTADTQKDWKVDDWSFMCGVTSCFYSCTLSRALNTNEKTQDTVFDPAVTGKLRAGWKLYANAAATSATVGYGAADLVISFSGAITLSVATATFISAFSLMY